MARRRGDWVPCQSWGGQTTIPAAMVANYNIILCKVTDQPLGSSGQVGVIEPDDSVLVHRVVGQVRLLSTAEDESFGIAIERIRVGLLDDDGGAAFFADNFLDASQANEPFLWQRVVELPGGYRNTIGGDHPWHNVIDVRVARKLDRTQALFYSVQWVSVGADLAITPFLRTWATSRG